MEVVEDSLTKRGRQAPYYKKEFKVKHKWDDAFSRIVKQRLRDKFATTARLSIADLNLDETQLTSLSNSISNIPEGDHSDEEATTTTEKKGLSATLPAVATHTM